MLAGYTKALRSLADTAWRRIGPEKADSTDIARGSGHPSEANDSNLDALREHESPLEVGDLKRSKKRLF